MNTGYTQIWDFVPPRYCSVQTRVGTGCVVTLKDARSSQSDQSLTQHLMTEDDPVLKSAANKQPELKRLQSPPLQQCKILFFSSPLCQCATN